MSTSPLLLLLFLLAVMLSSQTVSSKVVSETIKSANAWSLVSRFCFEAMPEGSPENTPGVQDDGEGIFRVTTTFKKKDRISVSLFFDTKDEWLDAYTSTATELMCKQRQDLATKTYDMWKSMQCTDRDCTDYTPLPWFTDDSVLPTDEVTVTREFQFRGVTRRWFYVVVSNCDSSCLVEVGDGASSDSSDVSPFGYCHGDLDLSYEFTMLNGVGSNNMHFSADEIGVLTLSQLMFSLTCVSLILMAFIRSKLIHRKKFHTTVSMLMVSIFLAFLQTLLAMIHYNRYSEDGVGIPTVLLTSQYIGVINDTLFTTLLILLAKGWTIVRRKISPQGRVKLSMFVTAHLCLSVLAITWSQYGYDVAKVSYMYESPPGQMIMYMKIVSGGWFSYSSKTTLTNFPRKHGFYNKFIAFGNAYLLTVPLSYLLTTALNDYHRYLAFEILTSLSLYISQTSLLLLYNPSTHFNRSFPFHSNTANMLSMYDDKKKKSDKKNDTVMKTSDKFMRLEQRFPAADNKTTTLMQSIPANTSTNTFKDNNTKSTINTVTGGAGYTRTRQGLMVISNNFDAEHYLRIRDVSHKITMELQALKKKASVLEDVLDAVTVNNAISFGILGENYERIQAIKAAELLNNTSSRSSPGKAVADPNAYSGIVNREGGNPYLVNNKNNLPKKIERRGGTGSSGDWRQGVDNVDTDNNNTNVLEMVTRFGNAGYNNSNADALSRSIEIERHNNLNRNVEEERRKAAAHELLRRTKTLQPTTNSKKEEREPERRKEKEKEEEETKAEVGSKDVPQTSPKLGEEYGGGGDSDDEFDREFLAAPGKEKPVVAAVSKQKPVPKGPPPGRPPSRNVSREGSRNASREGSRNASRENSPRPTPSASVEGMPREDGEGAVKVIKKVKKSKKERDPNKPRKEKKSKERVETGANGEGEGGGESKE
jgi:hypothetical protein